MNSSYKRKIHLWAPIVCCAMLAVGVWMGTLIHHPSPHSAKGPTAGSLPDNKIDLTLSLIERAYIDSLSTHDLVESLMPELMQRLDPHSSYIPAKDMQQVNEPLTGEFDGIGVVFNMLTDTVTVLNVIPGGPSYKAGILAGDRIVTIDGDTIAGRKVPQDSIINRLRGRRGSKVVVGIERERVEGLVPIEITRAKIPIKSIDAAFMMRPEVGYIRATDFARHTHRDFLIAVDSLQKEGMQSLILDLRGNGGGYLDQAIRLTDEFLPEGSLIVYTEDRHGRQVKEYSTGRGRLTDLPVVVLIDEFSASGSEILAGALQDNDRGTIIGRRSFGKGLVQNQIPFNDGSAIRLTVARYYTPTGRSIQKPYTRGEDGYEEDIINRYSAGEFFSADSIHFADSLRFTTPGGKTVYGGGGIMPDIFVPLDTLDMTPYYYAVTGLNVLYRYTLEYADRHRKEINSLTTLAEVDAFLNNDKRLLEDFVAYAEKKGIKPVWREINISRELLTAQLRAYIARNTALQEDGYWANIYPIDPTLQKAFQVLER